MYDDATSAVGFTEAAAWRRIAEQWMFAGLVIADFAILLLASALHDHLLISDDGVAAQRLSLWSLAVANVLIVCLAWRDQSRPRRSLASSVSDVVVGCTAAGFVEDGLRYAIDGQSDIWSGYFWLMVGGGLGLVRIGRRYLLACCRMWHRRTLVVGHHEDCQRVERLLQYNGGLACAVQDRLVLGSGDDPVGPLIERRVGLGDVDLVIIAARSFHKHDLAQTIETLHHGGVAHNVAYPLEGVSVWPLAARSGLGEDLVLFERSGSVRRRLNYAQTKRAFDLVITCIALVLLAPLMLVIALLVRLDGGPALYSSPRIGRHGSRFGCLKFRSMVPDASQVLRRMLADDPGLHAHYNKHFKLADDPRITGFGRLLRRSSLDELPQLFNVLKGDMSLIGPRPLLPDEVEAYGPDIDHYFTVCPGMSGIWQVSGRNALDYQERIRLNTWYVINQSISMDIEIMRRTWRAVLNWSGN